VIVSEALLGGLILGAIGLVAMAVMFWMIADMASRGQVGRGVGYAFVFLFAWPIGLFVWIRTRSRYAKFAPPQSS
jgi:cytochrome b